MDCLLRQEREGTLTSNPNERTFVFLKPESIRNRVVGNVISRLENKGFVIRHLKLHHITKKEAEELYIVHKGKSFFRELVEHIISGPVVLMILEGPNAVDTVRRLIGATNPQTAEPGTIRGDLSLYNC